MHVFLCSRISIKILTRRFGPNENEICSVFPSFPARLPQYLFGFLHIDQEDKTLILHPSRGLMSDGQGFGGTTKWTIIHPRLNLQPILLLVFF
jgi:hypothetical protein